MEATNFLVTGMFRSGTTLVARVLNANRNIICASDPFAPVFKAYRNSFGRSVKPDFDIDAPLHDYYFDTFQNDLFHAMQAANFDVSVDVATVNNIVSKVKQHSLAYSPLLQDHLHSLGGKNFTEVFQSGLRAIEKAYPKEHHQALGFKEVWVGEFTPHFLGLAEGAKVIHIVRDPRAVAGSNFVSGARYPLLFLARQWRKLATLAWLSAAKSSNNVKIIRFEDLVYYPEKTVTDICNFLSVDFDRNMICVGELKDGANQPWHQNSSYKDSDSDGQSSPEALNLKAVERWRSALPTQYVRLVEKLCYFEMNLFGYRFDNDFPEKDLLTEGFLFEDDQEFLSNWIKPYSAYDYCREMAAENVRHYLMRSGTRLEGKVEKLFALDLDAYTKLVSL